MRQKLVFFIALALALTQGLAAQSNPTTKAFRTFAGQEVMETVNLTFTDVVLPNPDPDPDDPVVRSTEVGDISGTINASLGTYGCTVTIDGANSEMFSADITRVLLYAGTNEQTVKVTVSITYIPTEGGIHKATLSLFDNRGTTRATLRLYGEAMVLNGDADGNGIITIADVSELIDYILNGDETNINLNAADVDGNGMISVADVSELIDILTGAPASTPCTFLIITKTDGNTYEYMIDENSKVKILDMSDNKWLSVEIEGIGYIFPLNTLEQWRYEEREVNLHNTSLMLQLDNESEGDSMTKADSLTLKTDMP